MLKDMKILAIANQKGGVGKTATTYTLATALVQEHSHRVLMVDTDPQASLTGASGVSAGDHSLADVIGGASPGRASLSEILEEVRPDLWLAPADISLSRSELGLVSRMGRENVLRKALREVSERFDVAIIDCPPSLSLLTVGALVAADGVLIPTQAQAVDLRGLKLFFDTFEQVKEELNPNLEVVGVAVTFYDDRLNHHRAAVAAMEKAELPLMQTRIGRSVRVAEAASEGETVLTYAPDNKRGKEYLGLAQEVEEWLKM
jgi:chromosome partitioning protein